MLKETSKSILPRALGRFVPWLKVLAVGTAGAFFYAVGDRAVVMLSGGQEPDPWTRAGLAQLLRVGVLAAIAYLMRSPRPRKEWSEEQRAAHKARLEAQGRVK